MFDRNKLPLSRTLANEDTNSSPHNVHSFLRELTIVANKQHKSSNANEGELRSVYALGV